jgi:hypothetical protein
MAASGIKLIPNALMPRGRQALVRGAKLVWIGPLGAPIEDAEFDGIILHPDHIEEIRGHALD